MLLGAQARHPAIAITRSYTVDIDRDITHFDDLRTTTVARTLVDLAGVLSFPALQRAASRAEFRRMLSLDALEETYARTHRPPGARKIRMLLGSSAQALSAESGFEREVISAIEDASLPSGTAQTTLTLPDGNRIRVDLYSPAARLVLEIDGPHHGRPLQRQRDAERDRMLASIGITVMRLPLARWRSDPAGFLQQLRQRLMT